MRVIILSSACCIHTRRWCNGLVQRGLDVHLVSQQIPMDNYDKRITIHPLKYSGNKGYILNAPQFRKLVKCLKPDIVNVHYASGYGTLTLLSGINNYIISVWGSDVYDFPKKSCLHKFLVTSVLNRSKLICSTSEVMAEHVKNYFKIRHELDIFVTPFGVDTNKFSRKIDSKIYTNEFVIGTVKTLRPKYGIDLLIKSVAELVNVHNIKNVRLKIAGIGHQKDELIQLSKDCNIHDKVDFLGWIENNDVPKILNEFDVYVAPSTLDSESFGVAIVEASSCSLPVIVSNVGGLIEVVLENETGLVFPSGDYIALSKCLLKLYESEDMRIRLGTKGRDNVLKKYDWEISLDLMISAYKFGS